MRVRNCSPCFFIHSNRGIALLEFTLSLLFIILVIGGIFDVGLGLWEYSYLHYTTTRAAREIAARLATTQNCGEIDNYLTNNAHKEMADAFAAGGAARWNYCAVGVGSPDCLQPLDKPAFQSFRLTGQLPLNCYFICHVLPNDWTVRTTITATIDNPKISPCPPGGPVP